ncbi:MAG TPA: hypothetical protein VM452_14415 [Caulifigura sp.]|jgi:hypothetical protein|nr:hypothetical protein [Caulifigura sp.]
MNRNHGARNSVTRAVLLGAVLSAGAVAAFWESPAKPPADPLPLKIVARLPGAAAIENSGLVQSRSNPDLFWGVNDSGNEPRVYAVHRDGTAVQKPKPEGVLIEGASNVDWEDIAAFDDGTLVIADVGNNANRRQDLTLYLVSEPSPAAERSGPIRRVRVRFPDQTAFPPAAKELNFDCEAVFTVGQSIHLLTKHRGDKRTTLYRLDAPQPDRVNTLTRAGDFDIGGMVTAADCDRSGKRLLVLTYQAVWLFERDDLATPFFQGRVSSRPILLPQAEAICFADAETALVTDELSGMLLEFKLGELRPFR